MSFFTRILPRACSSFSHTTLPQAVRNFTGYSRGRCFQSLPSVGKGISIQPNTPSGTRSFTQKLSPLNSHAEKTGGSTMHKAKKIGLAFLAGILLALPLGVYAQSTKEPSTTEQLQPIALSETQGAEWVRKCVDQYPEVLWLADAKVRKTEEGVAAAQGAYSEQLFGQKFIEFDRTIMTLHCLQLVLDGSDKAYQEFTAAQPDNAKLSKQSFNKLHLQEVSLLQSKYQGMSKLEMIQAMEAALVLGDIGKSEQARIVFKPYGAGAPDHDDFHGEVIHILQKNPELCPTFARLTPAAKKLLSQSANLAHYGHITHIEGGPAMFSQLKQSGVAVDSPVALSFDLFVHTCDVAGALGHVNNQSSLVYTEPSHRAMQGVIDACKVLSDPRKTEMDAYNAYLMLRADWLGLDPQDRTCRALVRMGAMLRLFTPEEGLILKQAVSKLDPDVQARIIAQLDLQDGREFGRTPTYMPAVLVNLANNPALGASKEERLSQAVILGLPFVSRVLEKQKQNLANHTADPSIPLNFNKAAGTAKTAPNTLAGTFNIDSEGSVCVSGR